MFTVDWITDRKIEHVNLCKNNEINPTETYYSEGDGEHTGQWFLERGTLTLSTLQRWQKNFEEMSVELKDKYDLKSEEPKGIDGESALVSWAYMDYRVNPFSDPAPTYAILPKVTTVDFKGTEVRQNFLGFENVVAHYINEMLRMIWESHIDTAGLDLPNSADYLVYSNLNDLEIAVQLAYPVLCNLEPYIRRGQCGDSVSWILNTRTSLLTLEGSGDTYNYDDATKVPWHEYSSMIHKIAFSGSISSIGSNMFAGIDISEISISTTITAIGARAFANCTQLEHFSLQYVSTLGESAFENCSSLERVYLGKSISVIPKNATTGCTSLKSIGSMYSISRYTIEDGNTALTNAKYYEGIEETNSWDATYGISGQHVLLNFDFNKATLELEYKSGDGYTADFSDGWNSGSFDQSSVNPAPWWRDTLYSTFMRDNAMAVIIPRTIKKVGTCVFLGLLIRALYISKNLQSVGVRNFPLKTDNTAGGLTSDAKIYYEGSEGERANILIGSDNSGMVNNTWVYNYGGIK